MSRTIETLENLVRVAKNKVENQQKIISKLYAESDSLTEKHTQLRTQMVAETNNAGDDVQLQQMAGKFFQRAHKEATALEVRIAQLATEIAAENETLKDMFAEQKRYEILLERKQLERKKRLERLQQDQLDEIGAIRARREES